MIGQKDPLIGTLPPKRDARSPALTGQDSSITGASGAGGIGQMPASQGSALAPAPSPGGNAQVGGAPLSSNEAKIRQGGAGADLDLVKDRGTPHEYWASNLKKTGSAKALDLMGGAANAASGKTGKQAEMNPEEVRRAGVQANEVFGVGNTREQQDTTVEKLIYAPMTAQVRDEVRTGTIPEDEGVMRIAQTMAQVQGAADDDEIAEILVTARKRMSGEEETEPAEKVFEQAEEANQREEAEGIDAEPPPDAEVTGEMDMLMSGRKQVDKETELKTEEASGKDDKLWKRFKRWVKKGRDDPSTPEDESKETYIGADGKPQTKDVEVTKFMGGMTRQELGMFVFQWGGLMMANSEKGLGGAMGEAGLGALGAHEARKTADEATERSDAQQKIENKLAERRVAASEKTAGMAGIAQGFTNPDGWWVVPKYDPETNQVTWDVATDKDGNKIKGDPNASRDYNGEKVFLDGFLTEAGWTKKQIADLYGGAGGPQKRRQDLTDALMSRISAAGIIDVDPITGKKYKEFKEADIKKWVDRMLSIEEGPALPSTPAGDGAALDSGSNKPASEYLNDAQT